MQWRHAEHTLAGELEGRDLDYHRKRFHHEHAAHDEEHNFLARDERHHAERGTEAKGAHIAHEHFRRISVEPQECQTGAADGAAEHAQFAAARDVGKDQVLGKHRIAGDISEHRKRAGDHHRRHDGQAVEAVGEINCIAGADNHQIAKDDKADGAERNGNRLEERHNEVRLLWQIGAIGEIGHRRNGDHRLPEKLGTSGEPLGIPVHHLAVVIDPAHDAEADSGKQRRPHIAVFEVAPQQGCDRHRGEDERPAHGRRAGFHQVRLRPVVAHRLADLERSEPADHPRADDE